MEHAVVMMDIVCTVAGSEDLLEARSPNSVLTAAISNHDSATIYASLMEAFSFQGISNAAAESYMQQHGRISWDDVNRDILGHAKCSKLRGYWSFHHCGYEKGSAACAQKQHFPQCPLPRHDLRTGRLNQTAYALYLFIRDIAGGDLVDWIDKQLKHADTKDRNRLRQMCQSIIEPMRNVFGVSDKILNMAMSDLLMAAPARKHRWGEAGANMIAIDTLVHNFLHRTGLLRSLNAQHAYGAGCYRANGCADIIAETARHIDARIFNPNYPETFPRFVQHALWRYCAQEEIDVCNGNNIRDHRRCANKGCPLHSLCDRVVLKPPNTADR